jgi:hypothetical protein
MYIDSNTSPKNDMNDTTTRVNTADSHQMKKKKTLKKNMLAFNVTLSHMSDRLLINMNDDCVVKEGAPRERCIDIVSLRQFVKQTKTKTQNIKDEHLGNKAAVREGLKELRLTRKDTNEDLNTQMKDALSKLKLAHVSESIGIYRDICIYLYLCVFSSTHICIRVIIFIY